MTDQPAAPLDEFREFRRSTIFYGNCIDEELDAMEERVIALEEIFAARWPRSWLLRWRYARELRASVAGYEWVGPGFRDRRIEALGNLRAISQEKRKAARSPDPEEAAERVREHE